MSSLTRPLVVGVTGIAGHALAERLGPRGSRTLGLARRGTSPVDGVESLHADLTDPEALRTTLQGTKPTSVFLTAWARQETEDGACTAPTP